MTRADQIDGDVEMHVLESDEKRQPRERCDSPSEVCSW